MSGRKIGNARITVKADLDTTDAQKKLDKLTEPKEVKIEPKVNVKNVADQLQGILSKEVKSARDAFDAKGLIDQMQTAVGAMSKGLAPAWKATLDDFKDQFKSIDFQLGDGKSVKGLEDAYKQAENLVEITKRQTDAVNELTKAEKKNAEQKTKRQSSKRSKLQEYTGDQWDDLTDEHSVNYNDAIMHMEEVVQVVRRGNKITADFTTRCKSVKTALDRFYRAIGDSVPEIADTENDLRESVSNGYFKLEDKDTPYGFYVEEIDGGYAIGVRDEIQVRQQLNNEIVETAGARQKEADATKDAVNEQKRLVDAYLATRKVYEVESSSGKQIFPTREKAESLVQNVRGLGMEISDPIEKYLGQVNEELRESFERIYYTPSEVYKPGKMFELVGKDIDVYIAMIEGLESFKNQYARLQKLRSTGTNRISIRPTQDMLDNFGFMLNESDSISEDEIELVERILAQRISDTDRLKGLLSFGRSSIARSHVGADPNNTWADMHRYYYGDKQSLFSDEIIEVTQARQEEKIVIEQTTDALKKQESYMYHAGKFRDNGRKAESLGQLYPGRGTGFYGTGTYGVDFQHLKEIVGGSSGYKNRPLSIIDTSFYKLFDATNNNVASSLHDFLQDLTSKIYGVKGGKRIDSLYAEFKKIFPNNTIITSYDEFKSIIQDIASYVTDNKDSYPNFYDLDSAPTKFMKHLGYEGVKTLGTGHADTRYGTVIYDLKKESIVCGEITDETQKQLLLEGKIGDVITANLKKRKESTTGGSEQEGDIQNLQKKMSETGELLGRLQTEYGDRFNKIFGKSMESFGNVLNSDNAEMMYDVLMSKEQEYTQEIQKRIQTVAELTKANGDLLSQYSNTDMWKDVELKLGEICTKIFEDGLSLEDATNQLAEFVKTLEVPVQPQIAPKAVEAEVKENIHSDPVDVPVQPVVESGAVEESVYKSPYSEEQMKSFLKGTDLEGYLKSVNVKPAQRKEVETEFYKLASIAAELTEIANGEGFYSSDDEEKLSIAMTEQLGKVTSLVHAYGAEQREKDRTYGELFQKIKNGEIKIGYNDADEAEFGNDWDHIFSVLGNGYGVLNKNSKRANGQWLDLKKLTGGLLKDEDQDINQTRAILELLMGAVEEGQDKKQYDYIDLDPSGIEKDIAAKASIVSRNVEQQIDQERRLADEAEHVAAEKQKQALEAASAASKTKEQANAEKSIEKGKKDKKVSVPIYDSSDDDTYFSQLREAKDNDTEFFKFSGVYDVDELETQLRNTAQQVLGSEMSIDSVTIQDNTALIKLYNEELGITASQMYRLEKASEDATEAQLQFIRGSQKYSPRAENKYNEAQQRKIDQNDKWLLSQMSRLNTQERTYKYSNKKISGDTALVGVDETTLEKDADKTIDSLAAHIKQRIANAVGGKLTEEVKNQILKDLISLENEIKIQQYKQYAATTMQPSEIEEARKELGYMLDSLESKARKNNVFEQMSDDFDSLRQRLTNSDFDGYVEDGTGLSNFVNSFKTTRSKLGAEIAAEQEGKKQQQDIQNLLNLQERLYESKKKTAALEIQSGTGTADYQVAQRKTDELQTQYDTSVALLNNEEQYYAVEERRLRLEEELKTSIFDQLAAQQKKQYLEEEAAKVAAAQKQAKADADEYFKTQIAIEKEQQKQQEAAAKEAQKLYDDAQKAQDKWYEAQAKMSELSVWDKEGTATWTNAKRNMDDLEVQYNTALSMVSTEEDYFALKQREITLDEKLESIVQDHVNTRQKQLEKEQAVAAQKQAEIEFNEHVKAQEASAKANQRQKEQEINQLLNQRKSVLANIFDIESKKSKLASADAIGEANTQIQLEKSKLAGINAQIEAYGKLATAKSVADQDAEFDAKYGKKTSLDVISAKEQEAKNLQKALLEVDSLTNKVLEQINTWAADRSIEFLPDSIKSEIKQFQASLSSLDENSDLDKIGKQWNDIVAKTNEAIKANKEYTSAHLKNEFQNNYHHVGGRTTDDDIELSAMRDFYNQQEAEAQQSNDNIKSIYDRLLNTVKEIDSLNTKINSLTFTDKGSGLYMHTLDGLQKQKYALFEELSNIDKEIKTKLNLGSFGADPSTVNFFDGSDISSIFGEESFIKFFEDARVQTALTEEEIQNFINVVNKADDNKFNFIAKLTQQIQPAIERVQALTKLIQEGIIDINSDAGKGILSIGENFANQMMSFKEDPSAFKAMDLMKFANDVTPYINALDAAAKKEREYFANKKQYTASTTMSSMAEDAEKAANKIGSAQKELTDIANDFAKQSGASGAIVTKFTEGADGIARLDFSVLDQGTNSLRKFSIEMGNVTKGTYITENTVDSFVTKAQAAGKQLGAVSDLIERLKVTDGIDMGHSSIVNLVEAQRQLNEELSKGDSADETKLSQYIREAKLCQTEAEKLYKKHMQLQDIIDSDRGAKEFGIDLNKDVYEQIREHVNAFATSLGGANVKIGKFNDTTGKLKFTMEAADGTLQEYTTHLDEHGKRIVMHRTGAQELASKWDQLKNSLSGLGKQFMTAFAGANIFYRALSELRKGYQYVKEIDLAMTELRKVTDETEASYKNFLVTASKTSSEIGSTVSDFTEATSEFARLGYTMDESAEMAKTAIVYKNVADGLDTVEESTESIISTMKAFGIESDDTMSIIDRFNEVGNNFAITSAGIGDALTRSASALYEAGNTIDESIALVTAANSVIQNPEQVGELIAHQHSNMLLANSYIG